MRRKALCTPRDAIVVRLHEARIERCRGDAKPRLRVPSRGLRRRNAAWSARARPESWMPSLVFRAASTVFTGASTSTKQDVGRGRSSISSGSAKRGPSRCFVAGSKMNEWMCSRSSPSRGAARPRAVCGGNENFWSGPLFERLDLSYAGAARSICRCCAKRLRSGTL